KAWVKQFLDAQVGAIEGEEALFTILSLSTGVFKFVGGMKSPKTSISTNWEYLLIEGMRRADEMSLALERGDIHDADVAPVDESTRMLVKNLSSLSECAGIAVVRSEDDVLYQSGTITKEVDVPAVAGFFVNLPDILGELCTRRPRRVSYIDQGRLVIVCPFKIFVVVMLFKKSALPPDVLQTIDRLIQRYEA
ncbi:MAG TPA: DUF4388 domain-containing protein, partial [Deltaproteobacteria bacterium]|nr:DUF4388 domain-containing protein [Deltaproteobacteria bacterium]